MAFDDSERGLNLGSDAGFHVLDAQFGFIDATVLFQPSDCAGGLRNVPVEIRMLERWPFLRAAVTGISKDITLFTMKQVMSLVEIVFVRRGGRKTVRQTRFGINTDVRFHTEVPLIALLGLVHLRIAFTLLVLV